MDRLFLDANILFSAAWGSPAVERIWSLAQARRAMLFTSAHAVEEARRNLSRAAQAERLATLLRDLTVVPETLSAAQCPVALPAKDRPILTAASFCGATHLITGDLRHLGAYVGSSIGGLRVSTVRDYLVGA